MWYIKYRFKTTYSVILFSITYSGKRGPAPALTDVCMLYAQALAYILFHVIYSTQPAKQHDAEEIENRMLIID